MHLTTPRRRLALLAAASALALSAGALTTMTAAAAAVGCRVDYRITNQWSGGFGADVTVANLGDPVNGWTLGWSFAAGQQVVQAWNATVSQSGAQVSARDAGYNAAIGTGGTANFGFNGSWNNASNPVPAAFTLNGTACTGAPSTSAPPSTPPPPTTPPPTTPPPSTPPPTT
ncbi:cellulose-binding domain-containing protein, partial [Micromonospora sp. R42003]